MDFGDLKKDFRVILLEDNATDIESLEELMGAGCTYFTPDNASDAVELLKEGSGNSALVVVNRSMDGRDPLTGALNLAGLRKYFEYSQKSVQAGNYLFCYADLKNFKYFNSVFGYEQGNELLKYWCYSIRRFLGEDDFVCRNTGDQIVSVHRDCSIIRAKKIFTDVLADVREHFGTQFGDYTINILAGIYNYVPMQNRGETFDEIIGYARQAQKSIKNKEVCGVAVFDDEMWRNQQRKIEINGHLEAALEGGEIKVYFQPQYNYVSGELLGAECLCRWEHKNLGFISPAEFIPALEESGKIYQLDYYVWDFACRVIRDWMDRGKEISLAVNVSRKDMDYADLPMVFIELVRTHNIPPELLRIEITESVFVDQANKLTELIRRFAELGFHVEMDDFGSGFSSLNLLHNIDVDVLKLDMSFLKDSNTNSRSGSIINAIVKMAHTLDINVLAEGVETVEQAEFLKNIGCLVAQGYFFSRPMPLEEFNRLVENSGTTVLGDNLHKLQLFNLQELFDRRSSGFFIFNNCMGPAIMVEYDGETIQPVIANDRFLNLLEWQRDKLEKHRRDVFSAFSDSTREKLTKVFIECKRNQYAQSEFYSERMDKHLSAHFRLVAETEESDTFFIEAADISRQKSMESKIDEYREMQQAQMEYMPCGTFRSRFDDEGTLDYVSDSLVSMLGFSDREELLAKYPTYEEIVYFEDRKHYRERMVEQLKKGDTSRSDHRMVRADGSIFWVYNTTRKVSEENGTSCFYTVVTDIDNIKHEQVEKHAFEQKLKAVMDIPGLILYEYDPEKDEMTVNVRDEKGVSTERHADNYLKGLSERNWVHKDFVKSYRETIEEVISKKEYRSVVVRALFAGGEYHLCKYFFSPLLDEAGNVYRVIGRAEKVEETAESMFDNMPVGTFRYSGEGNQEFLEISKGLISMLGFKSEEAFRSFYKNSFLHFVHPNDIVRVLKEIDEQLVASNEDYCEYRVIAADGSIKWLYDRGNVVSDEFGNRLYYVAVSDLSEYKNAQLARQNSDESLMTRLKLGVQQDPMTKLFNHEYSLEIIRESMEKGEKGILMLIDIDDFKWINDNKGHVFGDYVLCEFAKRLQALFRGKDVVGRYGGDEFICYIVGSNSRSVAKRKAGEIVKAASEILLAEGRNLGVSVGLAVSSTEITEVKQMVEQADEALYEVKRTGKRNSKIHGGDKE